MFVICSSPRVSEEPADPAVRGSVNFSITLGWKTLVEQCAWCIVEFVIVKSRIPIFAAPEFCFKENENGEKGVFLSGLMIWSFSFENKQALGVTSIFPKHFSKSNVPGFVFQSSFPNHKSFFSKVVLKFSKCSRFSFKGKSSFSFKEKIPKGKMMPKVCICK